MFYFKRFTIALILGVLLDLTSSRPHVRSGVPNYNDVLALNSNASVEVTRGGFNLVRRDPKNFNLCRGICNAVNLAKSLPKRSLDFDPAFQHDVFTGGLVARTLPRLNPNMDTFMVGQFAETNTVLVRVFNDDTGRHCSAEFRMLTERLDLGVEGLCGCSILVVVSREAVYFAHYFENLAFAPDDGSDPDTAFQNLVINFLRNGAPRTDGVANTYPSLASVADMFQTEVQAFIMTPQNEADTPQNEEEEGEDQTVTYIDGQLYADKIALLRTEVQQIMNHIENLPVTEFTYQAENAATLDGDNALTNTRKGKALYQFDPQATQRLQKARLIFEGDTFTTPQGLEINKGVVYFDDWPRVDQENLIPDRLSLFVLPQPQPTKPPQEGLLPCGGQFYEESKYTCYGETLCPVLNSVRTLLCGPQCYLQSQYTCYETTLCPVLNGIPTLLCGSDCYPPSQYSCYGSQLIQVLPSSVSSPSPSSQLIGQPTGQPTSALSSHPTNQGEEVVFNETTYILGPQTSTRTIDGQTIILEPSTIIIGTETIAVPVSTTGPVVIIIDGITITIQPAPLQSTSAPVSTSNPPPSSSVTEVVFGGSTFTLGSTSSTITLDGATVILGPSGIVIGTDTISLPASQTGPLAIATDGIDFTIKPGPSPSSAPPNGLPSSTSPSPGSTPTQSSPVSTTNPVTPPSSTVETLTASDGSSTIEITFEPTTLSQFSTVTAITSVTTTEDGNLTTIVVGLGGVVWEPITSTSLSGFPPISFPSLPPAPQNSSAIPPPISSINSNPFPSSQFPLPPIVTTVITTTGPKGIVVTTVTGTTNSGGVVVSVVTLSTAGAISSANSLASGLNSLSDIIVAFSSSTTDPARASAAVAAIRTASSDTNNFGRDLGIALAGLCFIFCSTVSAAASLLGTLDTTITGIISGTISMGALPGLVTSLASIAEELAEEAKEEEDSISKESESSTSTSSSSCSAATVTDCEVFCATGITAGTVTTTFCFSTTCSTVTSCSVTATTTTSFEFGFCPLTRPPSGQISLFSYPGYVPVPIKSDPGDDDTSITTTPSETFTLPPSITFSTSTISAIPTLSCGTPQSCELNNCAGTVVNGVATCKGAFAGCVCTPDINTPGFSCGDPQSCEKNNCDGTFSAGKATCTNIFAGCECLPSTDTPGFSCGAPQSCELSSCDGTFVSGAATCKNDFAGCTCLPSINTPGFSCGAPQSCELNNCGGTVTNGKATCKNDFAGCTCTPSINTPGFSCGAPQSCEMNNCDGTVKGETATCQNAFAGCTCIANVNTPGFCGPLGGCDFIGCQGTFIQGNQFGTCQAAAHKGCSCVPDTDTPGFCGPLGPCDFEGCQGIDVGTQFGQCQAPSHKGCSCILPTHSTAAPTSLPTTPSQPCEDDCTNMLTLKINGLKDQICTDDSSNNFIDSGTTGFVDWWRLDSDNNCFLVLAKSSQTKGFPDPFCFQKTDIQNWVTQNALGCNSGDAFFRPSPPINGGQFVGQGEICLSNFKNYQLCGSSTMNGGIPVIG